MHKRRCRHAGGRNPCPLIDFDAGFNALIGKALQLGGVLEDGQTIEEAFGQPFGALLSLPLAPEGRASWSCARAASCAGSAAVLWHRE